MTGPKSHPGFRQLPLPALRADRPRLDETGQLEFLQSVRKQGRRHQRDTTMNVAEMAAAG